MSKPPHSGPIHDPACLGNVRVHSAPTGHGHCSCARADWLGELVPRGRARDELLTQLANWATEQRAFTTAGIEVLQPTGPAAGPPSSSEFAAAGVWAAAQIAERIWIDVRMGALHLAQECAAHRLDPEPRSVGVQVPETVVDRPIIDVHLPEPVLAGGEG